MKYLVIDTETTISNKGNPFDPTNKLCVISWKTKDSGGVYKIEYDDEPYGASLAALQHLINIHDEIVFCNAKFDMHWLRKYGISLKGKFVYDVAVAYYIFKNQSVRFPSLNTIAEFCGAPQKIDKIAEYWKNKIDTPQIPWEELSEYALHDAVITEICYLKLKEILASQPKKTALLSIVHQDTKVLQEMEWNGIKYDVAGSLKEAEEIQAKMTDITKSLVELVPHPDADKINWNSPKQVSAVLYGGLIEITEKETYNHIYKNGTTKEKERKVNRTIIFPRLVEPTKNTTTSTEGVWSTAEPVIANLKASGLGKNIIKLLLEYAKLEKLHSTYLFGIPNKLIEYGWGDYLHGQLNQFVAVTGRLSSSNPNLQNMPEDLDKYFISRFGDNGIVVQFDVKGLEVLCAAYISQDQVLINELNAGEDIHSNNQAKFKLADRLAAKRFMFKMIYGGTAKGFSTDADFLYLKMSVDAWQEVIDAFYDKYKGIARWHSQLIAGVLKTGEYETPSGRVLNFKDILDRPEWYLIPKIKNYPVQSFGSDLVLLARVSLFNRLLSKNFKSLLINTIHDSIVLDIYKEEWYNINMIVKEVFKDLPENIRNIWKFDLGMKVSVEASVLTTGEDIHD